jgi:hypothetical protein
VACTVACEAINESGTTASTVTKKTMIMSRTRWVGRSAATAGTETTSSVGTRGCRRSGPASSEGEGSASPEVEIGGSSEVRISPGS